MSQSTPVLTVHPKFAAKLILIRILLKAIPGALFFTVWGGGMFGGILSTMQGSNDLVWANHLLAGSVCLVLGLLSIPVWYWVLHQNYANMMYRFYEGEVEYTDGFFFNKTRKVMSYKKVSEVEVDHGVLQQGFNLGTLKLITNATEGAGRAAGIQLIDITDADAVYQHIKPLVMAKA